MPGTQRYVKQKENHFLAYFPHIGNRIESDEWRKYTFYDIV